MTTKTLKLIGLFAGAAAICTSAKAADKALVDTLVEKGFLSSAEAEQIRHDGVDMAKHSYKGMEFKAKGDHTQKVRFNGLLQFQYDYLNAEDDNNLDEDRSQAYFRRVYFGAKGYLANDWVGEIVMDFADQDAEFDEVYIGYEGWEHGDVKFGYVKVPFGMEETTYSSKLKPIERSASTRLWSNQLDFAARHTGIHVGGEVQDTGLHYAASATNANQDEASEFGSGADAAGWAAFGRLNYEHDFQDNGSFLVGVDAGHQTENSNVGLEALSITAYNFHAKYQFEGFELAGEYVTGTVEDEFTAGAAEVDPKSWYLQGSYRFENWEPVVRYSQVDTDGTTIIGSVDADELIRRAPSNTPGAGTFDELESWYFGMTYYLMGNDLKFQGGYEYAEAEDQTGGNNDFEINGFRGRIQLLF